MTKKLYPRTMLSLALITLFILSSCSNSSDKTSEIQQGTIETPAAKTKDSANQAKLFSLPAPMQIASAIKKNCPNYFDEFLCPLKNSPPSDFEKTLMLGIYAVDLGYANVYDQKQTSINYFVASTKLADELKIMGALDPSILKAFKNNINNKDSVTHYTLSSFRSIHNNLLSNNRKDEAFLILTGSFIEGAYLSSKIQDKNKDKNLTHLIGEQKLFLENILTILPQHHDKKEMSDLIAGLTDLKTAYDKVDIKYKTETDPNNKNMEPIIISDDILKQINEKITAIRTSIFQTKSLS